MMLACSVVWIVGGKLLEWWANMPIFSCQDFDGVPWVASECLLLGFASIQEDKDGQKKEKRRARSRSRESKLVERRRDGKSRKRRKSEHDRHDRHQRRSYSHERRDDDRRSRRHRHRKHKHDEHDKRDRRKHKKSSHKKIPLRAEKECDSDLEVIQVIEPASRKVKDKSPSANDIEMQGSHHAQNPSGSEPEEGIILSEDESENLDSIQAAQDSKEIGENQQDSCAESGLEEGEISDDSSTHLSSESELESELFDRKSELSENMEIPMETNEDVPEGGWDIDQDMVIASC